MVSTLAGDSLPGTMARCGSGSAFSCRVIEPCMALRGGRGSRVPAIFKNRILYQVRRIRSSASHIACVQARGHGFSQPVAAPVPRFSRRDCPLGYVGTYPGGQPLLVVHVLKGAYLCPRCWPRCSGLLRIVTVRTATRSTVIVPCAPGRVLRGGPSHGWLRLWCCSSNFTTKIVS